MKTTKNNVTQKKQHKLPGVACRHILLKKILFRPYTYFETDYDETELDAMLYKDAIGRTVPFYIEEMKDFPDFISTADGILRNYYRMHFSVFSRFTEKSLSSELEVEILIGGDYEVIDFLPLQHFKVTFETLLEFDRSVNKKDEKEHFAVQSLSILWPHAREFVADILRRGGYIPALLPVIDPGAVFEAGLIHIWDGNTSTKGD